MPCLQRDSCSPNNLALPRPLRAYLASSVASSWARGRVIASRAASNPWNLLITIALPLAARPLPRSWKRSSDAMTAGYLVRPGQTAGGINASLICHLIRPESRNRLPQHRRDRGSPSLWPPRRPSSALGQIHLVFRKTAFRPTRSRPGAPSAGTTSLPSCGSSPRRKRYSAALTASAAGCG